MKKYIVMSTIPLLGIVLAFSISNKETYAEDYIEPVEEVVTERPEVKYVLDDTERLADFPVDGWVEEYIPETAQENSLSELTIFVGDSRTVGMEDYADDDSIYIAKVGKGYDWFKTDASNRLSDVIMSNSDKHLNIVVSLGVNDPDNAGLYVDEINGLKEKFPQTDIYFNSVGPTNGGSITNEMIENFNHTLQECLSSDIKFIDSYSYLMANGYDTKDGIHYTGPTYQKLHGYIQEKIGG